VTRLDILLAGHAAGTWVALDHDMTRILATGQTADEAIRAARPLVTDGQRPVLIQVRGWMAGTP
jgi:hypothetical protein